MNLPALTRRADFFLFEKREILNVTRIFLRIHICCCLFLVVQTFYNQTYIDRNERAERIFVYFFLNFKFCADLTLRQGCRYRDYRNPNFSNSFSGIGIIYALILNSISNLVLTLVPTLYLDFESSRI